MKNKTILLIMSSLFILSACGKKSDSSTTPSTGSGGRTPKATLSSWSVIPSSAFMARLDMNSANLTGTPFTLKYECSDSSYIHCSATMNGSESSGTFSTNTCTANPPSAGMCYSFMGTFPETGGTGSYSNDGTTLELCKANTACIEYN